MATVGVKGLIVLWLQMSYTGRWSWLKEAWFLLVCQGDELAAVTQLVCHVHYRPDAVSRWLRLAQLLLSQFADTHQSAVAHCCRVAIGSATVSMHSVRIWCYCSLKPASPKPRVRGKPGNFSKPKPRFKLLLVTWLGGNALVSISVVTLHRARLVLGWVTVRGRVNHLSM